MSEDNTIQSPKWTPPKGWEEITSDEKIERLREIIKESQRQTNNLRSEINHLRNVLFSHIHGENGQIFTVADKYSYQNINDNCGVLGSTNQKPYF